MSTEKKNEEYPRGGYHLALVAKPYVRAVLAGEKTVEARLTRNRVTPFGAIRTGDTVYLKVVSGEVEGIARVGGVSTYEGLQPQDVRAIEREFSDSVCAPRSFWIERSHARYAVLIGLEQVEDVRHTEFDWRAAVPRGSRSAWHVLDGPLEPIAELAAAALRPTG